ncbi:oxidoreductase [Robbsia andropogonis]|uniref:oxidoreductase n=1 Tax=Robbsia andropogonis TaxID=28092 RepID=UPI0004651090|nr:oxidoreductase [Robbsia andropogonis]
MTISENLSIALVGPGAIGVTVAAALHEVGRTPVICGRTAHEQLILRFDSERVVIPGPVLTDPANVKTRFDLVFIAVKATQIDAAAAWLPALCHADTVVCVLQNGVEQTALFHARLPRNPIVPSVVWFPAQRESDGSVWLRNAPRLVVPDDPAAAIVRAALHGTRCAVEAVSDFPTVAWRKLLQNAVAGLMVLTGRRAGMFSRPDIAALALAYARECLEVAQAAGAKLSDQTAQEVVEGFRNAPPDLGTSILADRLAGRPLEWDIRNNIIRRVGQTHGVPTPISDVIVPLLAAGSDGPG